MRIETDSLFVSLFVDTMYGGRREAKAIYKGDLREAVRKHAETNGEELCVVVADLDEIMNLQDPDSYIVDRANFGLGPPEAARAWLVKLREEVKTVIEERGWDCDAYELSEIPARELVDHPYKRGGFWDWLLGR